MPNASKMCPHSHMRRLNVKGWIKPRWKCNVEVKIECVMRNEWIDGLTTNHSPAPLFEQKWMWVLDVEEMESFSKIDLKDVSWWKSIKNACRLGAPITIRLSKKGCISLTSRGRSFHVACKHDWSKCAPPPSSPLQFEKHIPPKWVYWKYET